MADADAFRRPSYRQRRPSMLCASPELTAPRIAAPHQLSWHGISYHGRCLPSLTAWIHPARSSPPPTPGTDTTELRRANGALIQCAAACHRSACHRSMAASQHAAAYRGCRCGGRRWARAILDFSCLAAPQLQRHEEWEHCVDQRGYFLRGAARRRRSVSHLGAAFVS
eukprot:COSAG01_NODE_14431_length_1454_cov_63.328413_2_plen_168_part_00